MMLSARLQEMIRDAATSGAVGHGGLHRPVGAGNLHLSLGTPEELRGTPGFDPDRMRPFFGLKVF